jgi:hypothetical protein
MPTETHADCNKKYNLTYYTVKSRAVLTFLVCPSGGLYTKLTKEYNINGVQRLSVYVYNIEVYFRSALIGCH